MIYLGLNLSSWIQTSNLQLWLQKSINIVQCNLAKADPNPGLAKCLYSIQDDFLGNIIADVLYNYSSYKEE